MKLIFSLVSYSLLTTSYSDVFSVTHNSFRVLFCSNPDWTQLVISDWFDLIICVSAFFEETETILFVFTTWIVFNPTSRNQNEIRIFFSILIFFRRLNEPALNKREDFVWSQNKEFQFLRKNPNGTELSRKRGII